MYTHHTMKILVTHINPHLDDIAAIWLFKKFYPDFENASFEFISASKSDDIKGGETEDRVYFGIGKGRFDEHKGDKDDCATSLVWKEVESQGLAPKRKAVLNAYQRIVLWSKKIDLGQSLDENNPFRVAAFIRPKDDYSESSKKAVKLGGEILDRVLEASIRYEYAKVEWRKRVEFKSSFGKSYGLFSRSITRAFCKSKGGDLFLIYDPKYKSVQFFTPRDLDLEPLFKKLKKKDPQAGWYLHHSHHMIICGSSSAPDSKPTKFSFDSLVELTKSL